VDHVRSPASLAAAMKMKLHLDGNLNRRHPTGKTTSGMVKSRRVV
jgi:hypothetical protein